MGKKYILTMNEKQAKLLDTVCEFYARMMLGQWNELAWKCLDLQREDYCEARDKLEEKLFEAREIVWPNMGRNCSFGIGHFEDADIVWELHEVLRNRIAWNDHPEGGNILILS